jgi:hypothetical protein
MKKPKKLLLKLLSLLLFMLQLGCMDQDPFGQTTRDIIGSYELEQWEDGQTYYLKGPSKISNEAHGAIEGTVGEIGWNDNFILVWQNECGSGRGWRLINLKDNSVSELISKDDIENDSRAAGITTYPAKELWNDL